MCDNINKQLELETEQFDPNVLTKKDWYLKVLKIIFPYLNNKLSKITEIESDAEAIDTFLLLLAEEEIIEEDFLDIKGNMVCDGSFECIYYILQLLNTLVMRDFADDD